ncbi:MAG TPA: DUF302 domain-containing protein [Ohtaekwangia sp.]|nr:DUF302 domain-containing protein [Ohtaekwangia sp.]
MAHNYTRKLNLPFDKVVSLVRLNLEDQGFNIINTIDLKGNLKRNLRVDFRNYQILTACHTLLSYKAISLEPHIGELLPCNVVVQEHENGTVEVSAINPLETLDKNMITTSLELVAIELGHHLRTALDSLQSKREEFSFSY